MMNETKHNIEDCRTTGQPLLTVLFACVLLTPTLAALAESHAWLPVGAIFTEEDSLGESQSAWTTNYFYDRHGDLTGAIANPSDNPNVLQLTTWTYDKHSTLLASEKINVEDGTVNYHSTTIYTSLGPDQRQAVTVEDFGADGTDEQIQTTTTFNENGDPVLQVHEKLTLPDAVITEQKTSFWTYDFGNHQIIYTDELDLGADGSVNAASRLVYTLDDQNRPISWEGYIGNPHDFSGRNLTRGTLTYDKVGNLIRTERELLAGGITSGIRVISVSAWLYAHRGELIRGRSARPSSGPSTQATSKRN